METSLSHRIFCGNSQLALGTQLRDQILRLALLLVISGGAFSQEPNPLHEHAEIYVDQYFEPTPQDKLSEQGESRSSALGHFAVGRLQENQGQTEKAMVSYLKVLELQPGNVKLAHKTAGMLSQAGRNKQARKLLEDTLEKNSDQAFSYIVLSEFLSKNHGSDQDNKDRALDLAKEAVEKFPKDPLSYEHLSQMYNIGKRREDAQKLLESALEVENSDPEFWLRLGKEAGRIWPVRLKSSDNSKQISILNKYYDRASEFAGNDDSVLLRVADFYASTQQLDKAEEIYSAVVKRLAGRLDIRKKLASIYRQKNDIGNYIDVLNDIIRIDPGDVNSHRDIAAAYRKEKKIDLAIKHSRTALKLGKGSAEEYIDLCIEMISHSRDLYRQGKKAEANELCEDTVKFAREAAYLFPQNLEFHHYATYPLRVLGRYKEVVEHLEKFEAIAKKEAPERLDKKFYFDLGAACEQIGEIERASKLFQKSLEIMARSPKVNDVESNEFAAQVYNYLGYMWLENDMHIEQAGSHIKRAVQLDPKSAAIADSLGWYYFKVGRFEDALKELQRSEILIRSDPNFEKPDPVILDHIGQAYFALKKYDEAIKYMEQTIEFDEDGKQEFKDRLEKFRKAKIEAAKKDSASEGEERIKE